MNVLNVYTMAPPATNSAFNYCQFGSATAGVRKVHATGTAAAAETQFRNIMRSVLVALAYAMAILFGFIALIPLQHNPQPHIVPVMIGVGAPPVFGRVWTVPP